MPLKKRPLKRDSEVLRDATLVVIASEDTYAVQQYFSRFRPRRVQFLVIPTLDGRSSPQALIERIDQFRNETATEEGDQFWMCFDQDHWARESHIHNLHSVISHCHTKSYAIAISNPCFELWVLLHFGEPQLSQEGTLSCHEVSKQLAAFNGGYDKTKCCGTIQLSPQMVSEAIERAKKLETSEPIPNSIQTRVHHILELLRSRELIALA